MPDYEFHVLAGAPLDDQEIMARGWHAPPKGVNGGARFRAEDGGIDSGTANNGDPVHIHVERKRFTPGVVSSIVGRVSDLSRTTGVQPSEECTRVEVNVLGDAYEYLIERFADDAGKKGGEFYMPRPVVRLIVELLGPTEGMRICDPTAGSAGMLIYAAQYVAEQGGDVRNLVLHGQERNLGTLAIGKLNLLLHGLRSARYEDGDVIVDPRLLDESGRPLLLRPGDRESAV